MSDLPHRDFLCWWQQLRATRKIKRSTPSPLSCPLVLAVYMKTMRTWFLMLEASNCTQNIRQRYPDTKESRDVDGPRLLLLEIPWVHQEIEVWELTSELSHWEIDHALLLTITSDTACICYLLSGKHLAFVLTRKFSSSPIEALSGSQWGMMGCNNAMDVKTRPLLNRENAKGRYCSVLTEQQWQKFR